MYEAIMYKDSKGRCQPKEFLESLRQPKVEAKVYKWFEKLEEHGPDLPRPYADKVRGKIRELRVIFASNNYRFLYFFHHKKIIITNGFLKNTGPVPEEEINRAERLMKEFLDRNK